MGRPNAGKSRLFNVLTGGKAIVSSEPGTTRDYLIGRLDCDGVGVELIDTAGRQAPLDAIDAAAQNLGHEQAAAADLILVCIPADSESTEVDRRSWIRAAFGLRRCAIERRRRAEHSARAP